GSIRLMVFLRETAVEGPRKQSAMAGGAKVSNEGMKEGRTFKEVEPGPASVVEKQMQIDNGSLNPAMVPVILGSGVPYGRCMMARTLQPLTAGWRPSAAPGPDGRRSFGLGPAPQNEKSRKLLANCPLGYSEEASVAFRQ